jgi:nitrite reductase/ring-hydroxylating ferredoxin subunit/uncharacterized membrane protein
MGGMSLAPPTLTVADVRPRGQTRPPPRARFQETAKEDGMLPHQAVETLGQQEWLDATGDALQQAVSGAYESAGPVGQVAKDALHGVWLGHALHPVLTDVPIGAWTVTLALDLLEALGDRHGFGPGADAALVVGLAGAAGAAVTGLTDWSATDGEARRVGLVHGLMNAGVTGLYALSLMARRRGDRVNGRRLALLGYGLTMASGYLGGHLVYAQRVGVDHAAAEDAPRAYTAVLPLAELPDGQPRRVEADGVPVVLVRRGERVFALAERCAHLGGPLAEGKLEGDSIRCPWHGSRFDLASGGVLEGPSALPQPRFDVRVREGQIEIRLAESTLAVTGGATRLPAASGPAGADGQDRLAPPPATEVSDRPVAH